LDVFISHQTNDHDTQFVEHLAARLEELGADVWFDRQGLVAGNAIMDEVQRQIYDRPIFIVVLSPLALAAPWVRQECSWAWERMRQDPSHAIIPVTSQAIPLDLGPKWLFLQPLLRIEGDKGQPLAEDEAISKVIKRLASCGILGVA
jgi:hypothetical protein